MAPDGFIGAGLALLGKIVFDWLKGRNGHNRNGTSGEKSADYWELTIERIVEKVMERRNDKLKDILRQVLDESFRKRGL